MTYECSGPKFGTIRNPYDGTTMRVVFSVSSSGRLMFSAPDAYSPAARVKTAEEAYRLWNRVDGVEGMKSGKPIVCEYTGRPLHLVEDENGFRYEGGYDVRRPVSRSMFLHYATMRRGVAEFPLEDDRSRVEKPVARGEITRRMRIHADEMRTELTDEAVETAEKILSDSKFGLERSATVTGADLRKKGKRRAR